MPDLPHAISAVAVDGPLLLAAVPGDGLADPARGGRRGAGAVTVCPACRRPVVRARLRVRWHVTETPVCLERAPAVYLLERAYRYKPERVCRRAGEGVPFYVTHVCAGRRVVA